MIRFLFYLLSLVAEGSTALPFPGKASRSVLYTTPRHKEDKLNMKDIADQIGNCGMVTDLMYTKNR